MNEPLAAVLIVTGEFSNTLSPKFVSPSGSVNSCRSRQFANALSPITEAVPPKLKVTVVKLLQPRNARAPIVNKLSFSADNALTKSTDSSPIQFSNALSDTAELLIVKVLSELQP